MVKPVSPRQTTSPAQSNTETFSPEELALQKRNRIQITVTCSVLSFLALGIGVTGITLALILGSPVFLSLLIASVLFATVAVIAYKHLTKTPDGNWKESLSLYFREHPSQKIGLTFDLLSACAVSYYHNKTNPGIKLIIQKDPNVPFQLPLLAIPKNHKSDTPLQGIAFNAVSNDSKGMISTETNQARAFFSTFIDCHKTFEWYQCQYIDDSQDIIPFKPTEVRSCPITLHTTPGLTSSVQQHMPTHLGHVRGPTTKDFSKYHPDKMRNYYYDRALIAYEKCIDEALEHNFSIITLPLFSSVYELNAAHPNLLQPTYCQDLCKQALIEAIQAAALKYPNARTHQLLIILQDPFSSIHTTQISPPATPQ